MLAVYYSPAKNPWRRVLTAICRVLLRTRDGVDRLGRLDLVGKVGQMLAICPAMEGPWCVECSREVQEMLGSECVKCSRLRRRSRLPVRQMPALNARLSLGYNRRAKREYLTQKTSRVLW